LPVVYIVSHAHSTRRFHYCLREGGIVCARVFFHPAAPIAVVLSRACLLYSKKEAYASIKEVSVMKICAVIGSLRRDSYNRQLALLAKAALGERA